MPTADAPVLASFGVSFHGEYFHGLDGKNRVSLPAPWRKLARGRDAEPWILVPSPNAPCILGFSPAEFEAELSRIASLGDARSAALTAADLQAFSRQFNARARQCLPDRQGRLLIPSEMLAAGGFGRELALVGNRRRIEIWPPEEWRQRAAADGATYVRVAGLAGL